jgi:hypothetical protein
MLQLGRQGQLYVVKEASFGAALTIASADALRHLNFVPTHNAKNRRNNPEKKTSPGRFARHDSRETAGFSLEALLRPSGTLNTVPEWDEIMEVAFGAKTNPTLSTTVASGGTLTGATLTSGAGLAARDALLIVCPDGKKRVRFITAVNTGTGVVSWFPALPTGQIPANGAAVKSALTYKLATANALSLGFGHYLKKTDQTAGLKRALLGAIVDSLSLSFDAQDDPRFTVGGPAKTLTSADCPAQPAAFTTVGGNPPSGISGELCVDGVVMKFLKLAIEASLNRKLRADSYGEAAAEEALPSVRRDISVGLDARAEDQTVLYDKALAGTYVAVSQQTGFTEGNILAVGMPRVEFPTPDQDDPDEEVNWPFKGVATESALDLNDELIFAVA